MQLEMEEEGTKKKKISTYSASTNTFLIFVECFYGSGRTNSGHCSLALGEFCMLFSSQTYAIYRYQF